MKYITTAIVIAALNLGSAYADPSSGQQPNNDHSTITKGSKHSKKRGSHEEGRKKRTKKKKSETAM